VIASPPEHAEPRLHGRRIALGLFTVVGVAGLAGYAAYQASRVD
jgi:hypothetical protein